MSDKKENGTALIWEGFLLSRLLNLSRSFFSLVFFKLMGTFDFAVTKFWVEIHLIEGFCPQILSFESDIFRWDRRVLKIGGVFDVFKGFGGLLRDIWQEKANLWERGFEVFERLKRF